MPGRNPYETLKVPQDASLEQIEDAYDRLFDRYEPKARSGDQNAIDMLDRLNEARDTLVDRRRRAALDTTLRRSAAASPRTSSPAASRTASQTIRARRRSYPVEPQRAQRTLASYLPLLVVAAFLLVAVVVGLFVLMQPNRNVPAATSPGNVVATVNGVPIYERDWEDRITRDKTIALSDPVFSSFFNNFEGITGTRALDLIKFDSLDKLINAEVIMQEAKKEGIYPTPDQAPTLINQAKMSDLQGGITFEQFLSNHNITEEQYNTTVVHNAVYQIMANEHMPKTGTGDERTQGFIAWFCKARESYDVKINVTFVVTENPSCSSGLPLDVPLPGIDNTAPPEDVPTAAPAVPAGTPLPAGSATLPAPQPTAQP